MRSAPGLTRPFLALAAASALTFAMAPGASAMATVSTRAPHVSQAGEYRQLLGRVPDASYFEASVPTDGTYAIEYDVTDGVGFFDTYLDGSDLGYIGGGVGSYQSDPQQLKAGGHLLHVVGPEGSARAEVYVVSVNS